MVKRIKEIGKRKGNSTFILKTFQTVASSISVTSCRTPSPSKPSNFKSHRESPAVAHLGKYRSAKAAGEPWRDGLSCTDVEKRKQRWRQFDLDFSFIDKGHPDTLLHRHNCIPKAQKPKDAWHPAPCLGVLTALVHVLRHRR